MIIIKGKGGKGRNKSKVVIERKWGREEKVDTRKQVRKAVRT